MQKVQLAAALVAVLGFALQGPAVAADKVEGADLSVTEKSSPSKITKKVNLADEEKAEKTDKKAKKEKKEKGKEGSCKGKEGSCKGKEGSCKGKEGSCKGKEGSCKGKEGSCKSGEKTE
ncbi:MAG: hypothetical protein K2X93_05595 [Candidatus Obscuribacterales bacterium]|nr:hypothetical protein [Candidatus Obscuribacterales bacterium]